MTKSGRSVPLHAVSVVAAAAIVGAGLSASVPAAQAAAPSLEPAQHVEPSIEPVQFVAPTETATVVQVIDAAAFVPTSPDPSGIAWSNDLDRLLVVDSEVNQYAYFTGVNLWRVRRDGVVASTGSTDAWSGEPTGVTVDEAGDRFFTSDDVARVIYEIDMGGDGIPGTGDDVVVNQFSSTAFGSTDPEGLAYDTRRGWLHIVDGFGDSVFTIDPGPNGTFQGVGDDVISVFSTDAAGVISPEGIAYNEFTDRLVVADYQRPVVTEYSISGEHLRNINIPSEALVHPGGLTWGDSSDGSGTSLWVAARGEDVELPSDGKIFEFSVPESPIIRVTPEVVNFGPIGPEAKTVVVTNVGTDFLSVQSAEVTGDPAFSLMSASNPFVLAPHELMHVNVRYDGTSRGAHVGFLNLMSPDPGVGTYSVRLQSLHCPLGATPFTDVSPTSFAAADIACIYGLGVTTGTSPTTYSPGSDVTREQMASFLARLFRAYGS